ncbi:oligosaccharide flippase family protein [Chloroflexota bacterium]
MSQPPLRKTSFAGDVLKLVGGTTIAQALAILVAPLLTRLYAPEAFGIAALFASVLSIINVISCMRYQLAIVLPETDEEAANLLGVSLGFVVMITLLTIPIVWFGRWLIAGLLNAPALAPYLWLLPPLVAISGTSAALGYWNTRTKHFGRLSISKIASSVVAAVSKLGAGLAGHATEAGLIGATALGAATSVAVLGGHAWRDDRHLLRQCINWPGMVRVLRRYRKFPMYSTWTGLINTLSWQLPTLMLAAFFSPAVVGFYSLANRLVRTPMQLIGGSVARVFYTRAAEAQHGGSLDAVVREVYDRLVAYGLFPMLLITLAGKEFFAIVFGEQWAVAGTYAQILGVYMFFVFISSPLSQLFSVLERQEVALMTNVLLLLTRYAALWLGGSFGNVLLTLVLFSLSGVVVYGGFSLWIMRAAGIPLRHWWGPILRCSLTAMAFLSPAWLVRTLFNLPPWGVLGLFGLCAIAYYAWLLVHDGQVVELVKRAYAILPWVDGV